MAVGVDNCKAELLVKSLNLFIQCINYYGIRGQMLIDCAGML